MFLSEQPFVGSEAKNAKLFAGKEKLELPI
jgi:hypothetical protein